MPPRRGRRGLSAVVYAGGSVGELEDCAESRGVAALYALHGGVYLPYILGAPAFVNRGFSELFAAGLPAVTPLIVKSENGTPTGRVGAAGAGRPAPAGGAGGGSSGAGGGVDAGNRPQAQSSAPGQPAAAEQRPVRVIGGTGGVGVSHRDDCADGARLPGFGWADGEEVEVVADGEGPCAGWSRVRAGGVTSWVRERYLLPG